MDRGSNHHRRPRWMGTVNQWRPGGDFLGALAVSLTSSSCSCVGGEAQLKSKKITQKKRNKSSVTAGKITDGGGRPREAPSTSPRTSRAAAPTRLPFQTPACWAENSGTSTLHSSEQHKQINKSAETGSEHPH